MMYRIASKNGVARNCLRLHNSYPFISDIINVKELPEHRLPVDHDYEVSLVNGRMVYWKDVAIPSYMEHCKDEILGNQMAIIDDDVLLNDLYLNAGNTVAESKDFGTAGNGLKTTSLALTIMAQDGVICPCNIILNIEQFYEVYTTCIPIIYMTDKELMNHVIRGGEIFKTCITKGTGLVLPTVEYAKNRIIIHNDWQCDMLDTLHNMYRIYASFKLDLVNKNEICRLENI